MDSRIKLQAADDAWSREGQRVFGSRWGDVRYTRQGEGEPGSTLNKLYRRYVKARDNPATSSTKKRALQRAARLLSKAQKALSPILVHEPEGSNVTPRTKKSADEAYDHIEKARLALYRAGY